MLAQCPKCRGHPEKGGCKRHPLQSQESGESDESWEHNAGTLGDPGGPGFPKEGRESIPPISLGPQDGR